MWFQFLIRGLMMIMRWLLEMIVRYPSPPIRASRRAKTVSRTFPRRQISIAQHLISSLLSGHMNVSAVRQHLHHDGEVRPGLTGNDAMILPVTNVPLSHSASIMVCWFNQNLIRISIFVIICNWQPVLLISKVEQKTRICLLNLSLFYQELIEIGSVQY